MPGLADVRDHTPSQVQEPQRWAVPPAVERQLHLLTCVNPVMNCFWYSVVSASYFATSLAISSSAWKHDAAPFSQHHSSSSGVVSSAGACARSHHTVCCTVRESESLSRCSWQLRGDREGNTVRSSLAPHWLSPLRTSEQVRGRAWVHEFQGPIERTRADGKQLCYRF